MASIGIDLGTTNSVAAHIQGGRPVVIPNRDAQDLTPSVVSFRKTGTAGFLVGMQAINYATQAPLDTIFSIKRLMGLDFDDVKVQVVRERVPYTISAPPDGVLDRAARVLINGQPFTPIDLSMMILERIRHDCAHHLGVEVDGATITVPAYFQECQRTATREAGERAGLRLRPLLDEPTAAALAFVLNDDPDKMHRILVYDLGGGTFDVSLVQIAGRAGSPMEDKNVQVLEKDGNMWLGGDDFDHCISRRIFDWLGSKHGIDGRQDPRLRRWVKALAERAKKALTDQESYRICEPRLLYAPEREPVSIDLSIDRATFEHDISPMIEESMGLVEAVLQRQNIKDNDLTAVVLVGGSTLVPMVRKRIKERFGKMKVRHDINPMLCVSLGAALWNQRFPMDASKKISLVRMDQTGMPTQMDLGVEIYRDGNAHAFEKIIPKGNIYPTREPFKKTFRPTQENQKLIRVPIFQGTSSLTSYNSCQGVLEYELPGGLPSNSKVEISFAIDEHGSLTVEVEVVGRPDYRKKIQIKRNQPYQNEKATKWKEELENLLSVCDRFVTKYRVYLTPEQMRDLNEKVQKGKRALAENDRHGAQPILQALRIALLGAGTASVLFLAERAQEMADSRTAQQIALARATLEKATIHQPEKVQEIIDKLKPVIHKVLAIRSEEYRGPLPGQMTL
ncbi:MAG: Hsp70 family protein [Gemmataceae bacterium]